jgi:hypothetical protein
MTTGSLRQAWDYFPSEVWDPLAEYSSKDATAPQDLFSDLFAVASDYLSPGPTPAELEEARNDPETARQYFFVLRGGDFPSECDIVHFLEEADTVIADYDIPGFEDLYIRLLRAVFKKFNLRYRLDDHPFVVRFMLPGTFSNMYSEIQRITSTNPHLAGLLNDFEKAFDRYARTQDATDLKTCIAKASNYAEGLASATYGTPGTLGAICNQLTDWPHDKVKEALQHLYKFCSDYPGIRHAGNPAGVRRALATRDLTIASMLIMSFSGYLSPHFDERTVLGL